MFKICRYYLLGSILLLAPLSLLSQQIWPKSPQADRWVDSLMNEMSLDERIGQLFMVTAYSNKDASHVNNIKYMLRQFHVGGIIFMQGDPLSQAKLTNEYQSISKLPLVIAQDAEWGLNMRLKQTMGFPKNMTLGAIRDDSLLYEMGQEMGDHLRRIGVHINFAPVVDINNNPKNPVIHYRSYGENKFNVSRKGILFSKGLMSSGVMPCAKHFPGHGDTGTDSHHTLPVLPHSKRRLDTLELYPFFQMVRHGIPSMMVAHLHIPSLDTVERAASLSPEIVEGILRSKLQYDGLLFTDALNMRGVMKYGSPGEVALQAIKAGNDILLSPEHVGSSFVKIKNAVKNGELSQWELDLHIRRILYAKYHLGLHRFRRIPLGNIEQDLKSISTKMLRKALYESAITLPKNKGKLLPLKQLERRKIAYVQFGGKPQSVFSRSLKKYAQVETFFYPRNLQARDRLNLLRQLEEYNTTIVGIFGTNYSEPNNFGIRKELTIFSEELSGRQGDHVLALFGTPYGLRNFGKETAVMVAYEEAEEAQEAAASAIFGGITIDGRLPVSASPQFPAGVGEKVLKTIRFGFAIPEEWGLSSQKLTKIDSIANFHISDKAMPGCAIMVMRGKDIVFEKAYGRVEPWGKEVDLVENSYDLASITKIATTTLITMRLVEQGLLDLDKPIKTYVPAFSDADIGETTPRRLLQHNAGLAGWVPFYIRTYKDERRTRLHPDYYQFAPSNSGEIPITQSLFMKPFLQDSMRHWIKMLEVRPTTRFRYSDLGPILMGKVIESITGERLDEYAHQNFYAPLGMGNTFFNPALKGKQFICPPTENDTYWRKGKIQGYVNDPTAALMGGVAGNAGLFSNVYDLGKLFLMMKNGGAYGDRFYLRKSSIDSFTKQQRQRHRRGLGFDKPEIYGHRTNPVSSLSSFDTYGHTGFTGTCVWVDPVYDLVYVFLSNRTYPSKSNQKLVRDNVRTKVMDVVYGAIMDRGEISP